jgi:FAD binding domain
MSDNRADLGSAGDAAHSFPPTGGLGLNSGLADVHNLAYKIAAVHQGWGGSELLDTYEADRRQIALVNSQQSVKNGQKIFDLLRIRGKRKTDVANGIKNLDERLEDSTARWAIAKGVEGQREHFDNLGLHIGYVYGDTELPASASLYIPAYRPGARLPHAWITNKSAHPNLARLPPIDCSYVTELTAADRAAKEYSTLDLCPYDAFTLIIDSSSDARWTEIAHGVTAKLPKAASTSLKVNVIALGKDFELVPGARAEEWIRGLQLDCGSAVLVRPDQHILDIFGRTTTAEQVSRSLFKHLDLV